MLAVRLHGYHVAIKEKGKRIAPPNGQLIVERSGGTMSRVVLNLRRFNGDFVASIEVDPKELQAALKAFL